MAEDGLKMGEKSARAAMTKAMSRRNLLIGAGGAGAAAAAAVAVSGAGQVATVAGPVDPQDIRPLGDGFYLVDGWVLAAEDLPARLIADTAAGE